MFKIIGSGGSPVRIYTHIILSYYIRICSYVCVHKVDALLDITVLTTFGKGG